jgi:hypothetical protein
MVLWLGPRAPIERHLSYRSRPRMLEERSARATDAACLMSTRSAVNWPAEAEIPREARTPEPASALPSPRGSPEDQNAGLLAKSLLTSQTE